VDAGCLSLCICNASYLRSRHNCSRLYYECDIERFFFSSDPNAQWKDPRDLCTVTVVDTVLINRQIMITDYRITLCLASRSIDVRVSAEYYNLLRLLEMIFFGVDKKSQSLCGEQLPQLNAV
jgi:hypothetical protein